MTPDILTHSGHYFDFLAPHNSVILIEDIAHALSRINRFTGHTKGFYSVAQHCVLASYNCDQDVAFQCLMHDAAEAYVGDMPSPLKMLLPEYKVIEKRVEAAVFQRFGLPAKLDPRVKAMDLIMLLTEQRDLMPRIAEKWSRLEGIQPLERRIRSWDSDLAKQQFLTRFNQLAPAELRKVAA